MDDTLQQDKEYKNPNDEQGGIRRRLRDRDLLRKRKAEAEEKETNQVESQRKRARAEGQSGSKRRGRPRKSEPSPEITVTQEEAAEGPAVVVVSEPAEVIPDQASSSVSQINVEIQPTRAPPLLFGFPKNVVIAPTPTSPVKPTPSIFSPSVPSYKFLDRAPIIPALDLAPVPDVAPVQAPIQAPFLAATPPPQSPQVENLYIESEEREEPDQVLIEDLGPDEEEDVLSQEDKGDDDDLNGTPLTTVPEQNKMFSLPTLSSPPPPQEYFPRYSY